MPESVREYFNPILFYSVMCVYREALAEVLNEAFAAQAIACIRDLELDPKRVNIYGGGIMRCDTIAEAIASAVKEGGLGVPLVVRAAGTNKEICKKVLTGQGIDCAFVDDIAGAAKAAIAAARREAA